MVAILFTYAMLAFGAAGRAPGGKQNEFNWKNFMGFVSFFGLATMMYSLTVRGTQALVSFAPLAFKLFFAPLVRTLFFAARPFRPV